MSSILRIRHQTSGNQARGVHDPAKSYLERLVKLIPGEVMALYLAGSGAISAAFGDHHREGPASNSGIEEAYWWGWTAFCFFAVILIRAWATASKANPSTAEWPAVSIAAVSFLIWVYSLGDAFERAGWWEPLFATLLVLAWTFVVPIFYRDRVGLRDGSMTRRLSKGAIAFTESESEQAVLNSADSPSRRRPSLSHNVSLYFESNGLVRNLLGKIQDYIFSRHRIWVELADVSDDTLSKLGEGTFSDLATWVRDRVLSTGAKRA